MQNGWPLAGKCVPFGRCPCSNDPPRLERFAPTRSRSRRRLENTPPGRDGDRTGEGDHGGLVTFAADLVTFAADLVAWLLDLAG
jgi:hypothetical protein